MPSDIEKASAEDETLQVVPECIKSGDWKRLPGTIYGCERRTMDYWSNRNARKSYNPTQKTVGTRLAHEGHQGIVRKKSRLREMVWWPNIDKQVESFIKACYPCQLVARQPRPEPTI